MGKSVAGRLTAIVLAVCVLCAGCGAAAKASTMRLKKTEGTVKVADAEKKPVDPVADLMLYSGYGMGTQAESFAWIGLDEVKLVKLDENTEIEVRQEGKHLTAQVNSGSLFFHVTQPLAEDETMDIQTSSMLVGIRGTCGWVSADSDTHAAVYILEGTVSVSDAAGGGTVSVSAGQMAEATVTDSGETQITTAPFPAGALPAFVLAELAEDEPLAAQILEDSGLDVLNPPDPQAAWERILALYRDAAQNALPYDEYGIHYDESTGETNEQYSDRMVANLAQNVAGYPNICSSYFQFNQDNTGLYSAYHDLDGNGTEELFIGAGWGDTIFLLDIYAFDGTDGVSLSRYEADPEFEIYFSVVTADGLIMDARGNGSVLSGIGYRLGADGFSLERDTSFDAGGGMVYMRDPAILAAHGGDVTESLVWEAFA